MWDIEGQKVVETAEGAVVVTWKARPYQGYDGEHTVSATYSDGRSHTRKRTWKGETAWMSAQRHFEDIVFALNMQGSRVF